MHVWRQARDPGGVTRDRCKQEGKGRQRLLQEAYDGAVPEICGENKVQEIMDKYPQLPADIRWHMIGHLQRNKVKYIVDKAAMIHSVDSFRLAQTIEPGGLPNMRYRFRFFWKSMWRKKRVNLV